MCSFSRPESKRNTNVFSNVPTQNQTTDVRAGHAASAQCGRHRRAWLRAHNLGVEEAHEERSVCSRGGRCAPPPCACAARQPRSQHHPQAPGCARSGALGWLGDRTRGGGGGKGLPPGAKCIQPNEGYCIPSHGMGGGGVLYSHKGYCIPMGGGDTASVPIAVLQRWVERRKLTEGHMKAGGGAASSLRRQPEGRPHAIHPSSASSNVRCSAVCVLHPGFKRAA